MVGDLLRLVRLYYALPFSAGFLVILAYLRGGELESIRREAMLSFFSLLCVISAGYVFNDVCDVRIDRINCPGRVLAAGRLTRTTATAWAGFLFVVGMLAAGLCGPWFLLGTGAMAAGLACYDLFSKRIGIFKDLLVAVLLTSLYPLAFTLAQPVDTPRLKEDRNGKPVFVIAWSNETVIEQDILIVQQDIRAVQLAMAAVSTGAKLMLKRVGIDKPEKVILAGAFGSVIDPQRALLLGMFPDCGLENVISVGNAAGDGARIALLNKEMRIEAEWIARQVEYIELTQEPEFNEIFVQSTHFPSNS